MTQKSDIKHWSNSKGEGKLFSVTFMDETVDLNSPCTEDANPTAGRNPGNGIQRHRG